MDHSQWALGHFVWSMFVWLGFGILLLLSIGIWSYSYRVRQKAGQKSLEESSKILKARFTRREITLDEH